MLRMQFVGGLYDGGALELEEVRGKSRKAGRTKAPPVLPEFPARVYLARDGFPYASCYKRLRNLSAVSALYEIGEYVRACELPRGAIVLVVA